MSFGIAVLDAAGVQTLGMDDFTIQKLAVMTIPASKAGPTTGARTDYILMDVPGYDPSTCLVIITPKVYASYNQPGYPDSWGYTPTYKDLGGTQIAIYTYANRRNPTGIGNNYTNQWVEHVVESVVEVVKVI
jgi:hypothetical protein